MQQHAIAETLAYLKELARNNRKDWFDAHRERYDAVRADFETIAAELIEGIGSFDPTIAGLPVQSTLYRFHRDTRFSLDKSPYKRHLGCYISARGKKSPHGGYYLHLEPGNCMVGGGAYCLDGPVLKAVRQGIVDRLDSFRAIVEAPDFRQLFPVIGEDHLKTLPKGFDRDFPFPQYLRPRNYAVLHPLPDAFFDDASWMDEVLRIFRVMKPFLDFVNEDIDDCL
ncbi:Uncharacterized conserved protein UCP028451 [gut metagenome]|uniref:Uncharacterized conserved protein UCP028451 n=1 Tax=gut metagenome TaxID=749906 RepID=J9GJM3_9ZZZZ